MGQNIKSTNHYLGGDSSKEASISLPLRAISSGINGRNSAATFFSALPCAVAVFAAAFLASCLTASIVTPVQNSNAETVSATLTAGGHYVSISSSGTINLNLQSTADGSIVVGKDTVTTTTNSETGYKLYISTNSSASTSRNMYLNGDNTSSYYLSPSAGTVSSPTVLATNTWGYALASTINTTSSGTNGINGTVTKNSTFIGVPTFGTLASNVINSVTSATTSSSVDVYYGVNANTVLPSGTYISNIVYTVIAEALDSPAQDISVTSTPVTDGDTIEIATGLYTNLTDLGTITVTVGGKPCSNVTILNSGSSSAGYVNLSCSLPASSDTTNRLTSNGDKTVVVSYSTLGKTFTATDAVDYYLPWDRLTYMQDMTSSACDDATIATSTDASDYDRNTNYAYQRILTDNRDGNTYIVRKLKDGNCWMTENLRLTFSNGYAVHSTTGALTELTSDNSDFTTISSWTGGGTTETAENHTVWYSDAANLYDLPKSYSFGDEKSENEDTTQYKGVFYNWVVATGGNGLYTTGSEITIEDSICPAGWRLPSASGTKSWSNLIGIVGSSTDPGWSYALRNPPYSLIRPFYYSSVIGEIRGSGGTWWTATARDNIAVYDMYLSDQEFFNTTNSDVKGDGRPIRCVNR